MLLNDSLASPKCDKLGLSTPLKDAKDRILCDILLHLYITMKDSKTITLLEPFKRLIHRPEEMKVGAYIYPKYVQSYYLKLVPADIGAQRSMLPLLPFFTKK